MVLYNDIESAVKVKKQKLNNAHIRNLKIMNVLNALVMILLIMLEKAKMALVGVPSALLIISTPG